MGIHLYVRIHRLDPFERDLHLGSADVCRAVQHLALQVGGVDPIVVHDADRPNTRGRQILGNRAAEPPGADQQDPGLEQPGLPFDTDLGQAEVAPVAIELIRAQRRFRRGHGTNAI